ncbi:MAG TPA: serine/threonine-protein kinase [Polyangia bacterium]|nr:serine/threonine-protein kinase [Polyangia bacterium]
MRHHAEPETEPETLRRQARPEIPAKKIDRYELGELIGCGGMGAVYRAVDTKLGRTVALKTATGSRSGARLTDRVRQRFLREAMALSKVEHRNVVQVLDFGFADDGTPFLVMEYLRGRDLGELLVATNKPLGITEAVDIMLGVCAALRACHRVGIIHRDLKPGNIFLAETDTGREVKVLDFGVSKAPTADDLTREGQILGTPQYLAPEQIDGKVGPASDQYALGVLLYVCLTLHLPYEEVEDRALLRAIETGRFEAPRELRKDLPEELEAIVLRAMHICPSERFESVYALGQRLWALASPRAQNEWRGYYYQAASRGGAAVAPPILPPILARTQILEASRGDEPESDGRDRPSTVAGMERAGWPEAAVEPSASHDSELRIPRGPRRLVGVVVLLLIAGAWFLTRAHRPRPAGSNLPVPVAPPRATAGPTTDGARPSAPAPTPAALPATPSEAVVPPPEDRPVRSRHRPRARARQEAPFSPALPNIDPFGIGIPSE